MGLADSFSRKAGGNTGGCKGGLVMRKLLLFGVIVALLASTAVTVYAAPPEGGPPGLDRAIAAQEAHNPQLLSVPGVVGTAVGLNGEGEAAVKIYTGRAGIAGLPKSLDGIPVEVQVTGKVLALKGPPPGKGPKKTGPSPTDRWPRPVPIGISTGNANECSAGTIAARVRDTSGNVYALSNNHVYARENSASPGEEVLQPGLYDTGCVYDPNNVLGNLFAFQELLFNNDLANPNIMDAAIALTDTGTLKNETPPNGYGKPSSATQAATVDLAVQKYGRTTGLTSGKITAINWTGWVSYDSGSALFADQIVVEGRKPFLKAGDSGSLLVTQAGNNPVGLLFAGNRNGKMAIASPIGPILERFGVTIDGG